MATAMARQEHRLRVAHASKSQGVRRIAPRGRDPLLAQVRQAGKLINSRPAYNPYDCFGHAYSAPLRAAPFLTVAPRRSALNVGWLVRGCPDPLFHVVEQHRKHEEEDQNPEA